MDKHFAVFDMDGTLVDSMVCWKHLAAEFLESRGIQRIAPAVLERIKPMTMVESAALFIQEYGLDGTAESIAAEMNALMDRHYRRDIPLKPGVQWYLETLHRRGVRMCVASATAEELVASCLTRLGAAHWFSFLLSCETVGAGKTRPDIYLEAARRFGAQPAEIAVYEDALYAADTARKAGFYVIAVQDDSSRPHWDPLTALSDEQISDWCTAAQAL